MLQLKHQSYHLDAKDFCTGNTLSTRMGSEDMQINIFSFSINAVITVTSFGWSPAKQLELNRWTFWHESAKFCWEQVHYCKQYGTGWGFCLFKEKKQPTTKKIKSMQKTPTQIKMYFPSLHYHVISCQSDHLAQFSSWKCKYPLPADVSVSFYTANSKLYPLSIKKNITPTGDKSPSFPQSCNKN